MDRRRMRLVLGVIVAAAGLAVVPRIATNAQEPDRPSARQTLRQRIADLRGEVGLREVELEIERESLKLKLMSVPKHSKEIAELRSHIQNMKPIKKIEELDKSIGDELVAFAEKLGMPQEAVERDLDKAVFEASKTKEPKAISKAILKWVNDAENWAKGVIDKEFAPLKKDFARHASDLAMQRMELDDLEKQYRDSR